MADDPNDRYEELRKHYQQYELDFGEEIPLSPAHPRPFKAPSRLYSYPEFLRLPFPLFLNKNSQAVIRSKKVYNETDIRQRLSKKKKKDGTPYSKEEIDNEVKVGASDLIKKYDDGWQIVANIQYGLPSETDSHVWDFIMNKASQDFLSEGKFFHTYSFSEEEVIRDLVETGRFKGRGGKQKQLIRDAIFRLQSTQYSYDSGIRVRVEKGKNGKHKEKRIRSQFNLLSAVYTEGETLPDGSTSNKISVVINPLIVKSLSEEHFFIIANERRQQLKKAGSRVLHDRISYWIYIKHLQGEIKPFQEMRIQPFQVIGYEKICELLGIEPLTDRKLVKSRIQKQLQELHEELELHQIICWYDLDEFKSKGKKQFNIVYAISNAVIDGVTQFFSKKAKIDERMAKDQFRMELTDADNLLTVINKRIHSQAIRRKLLSGYLPALEPTKTTKEAGQ